MIGKNYLKNFKRIFNNTPRNTSDLIHILKTATDRKVIEPNTLGMLEGVLNVQETRAKDVMVPRSQMVTIEKDSSLERLIPIVVSSRHSRFPVMNENKEEVFGIVLAKDLISYGFDGSQLEFNIKDILRPVVFIPENKRLNVLLQDFRINNNHMAIVVSEYGRITGLITIEDVLEQIVGEIEDEYDTDNVPNISPQTNGIYNIKSLTTIEEFNSYFSSKLFGDGVETIGGLVMRNLGHMPKRGEIVTLDNFKVTVLRADNRRLHLLSVTEMLEPEEDVTDPNIS